MEFRRVLFRSSPGDRAMMPRMAAVAACCSRSAAFSARNTASRVPADREAAGRFFAGRGFERRDFAMGRPSLRQAAGFDSGGTIRYPLSAGDVRGKEAAMEL